MAIKIIKRTELSIDSDTVKKLSKIITVPQEASSIAIVFYEKISKDKRIKWTDEMIDYLKKNYPSGSFLEIEKHLKLPPSTFKSKAQILKLKRLVKGNWETKDEVFLIKHLNIDMDWKDLATKLGRTKWGIINKHRELTGKRKKKSTEKEIVRKRKS